MKTSCAWLLCLVLLSVFCPPAAAFEDMSAHPSCAICGMDRKAFGSSRMMIEYGDGTSYGLCSLRCAAFVLRGEEGKKLRSVRVADYETRELVEAEEAVWVIGGTKPGVMTRTPKWAFRNEESAERFLREFGGERAAYREALRKALEELE